MSEATNSSVRHIEAPTNQSGAAVQRGLEGILLTLGEVQKGSPLRPHPELRSLIDGLKRDIGRLPSLERYPTIRVDASLGKGRWAAVPWIALMDERETKSTQRGIYIVLLFSEDRSGVYLTLNQGITDIIKEHGRTTGRRSLEANAEKLRAKVGYLREFGFSVDRGIDLHTAPGRGQEYEHSTVAYKLYSSGAVPDDASLDHDLDALLQAYAAVLERDSPQAPVSQRSWIFQANPEMFDIDGAIAGLTELSWLVNQHRDSIHGGDEVFLWRSGPAAGIVATATVLCDPMLLHEDDAEKVYNRQASKFEGDQVRVRLRIEQNLERLLPKSQLIADPKLKDLSILKAPMGTNFPVTAEEAAAITARIAAMTGPRLVRGRVWIYAPGRAAEHWDEFYRDGIIGVGWDDVGDFRQYKTLNEMSEAHITAYSRDTRPINDARACWEFATQMAPGDLVFARQGLDTVIGYGVVTGDYDWQPGRMRFNSVRTVRWEGRGSWRYGGQFPVKTLSDITEDADLVKALRTLVSLDRPVAPPPAPPAELPLYSIDQALVDST